MGSGAKIGPTSAGAGLVNTASTAGASSSNIPALWQLSNAGTLFVSADFLATPSVGNGWLWGLSHSATNTSPFTDYGLFVDFTTKKLAFSYNAAGTAVSQLASFIAPTTGHHSAAVSFIAGGAIAIYQDALPYGSGTWSGAGPSYVSPVAGLGGNVPSPTRISDTGIAIALTYNRALSAAEIAVLDADPFCMLRAVRRPVFGSIISLPLTSQGSAFSFGRGALSLSQPLAARGAAYSRGRGALTLSLALASRGAGYSRGQGALSLTQPLAARGAAYSHGRGALSLSQALASRGAAFSHGRSALTFSFTLASRGAAFSQGRGALSLAQALTSLGSARAQGQGVLSLSQPLTSRGAAFSRGRGTLTLFLPLALTSLGSARSTGKGSLVLSLALTSQGSAFSRGSGVLTIGSTPLALVSRGIAFSHGQDVLTLPVIVALHSRGQAFAHGGMVRGGQQGTGTLTLKPFVPFQNIVDIGFPQRGYPMVDPKTGLINETWYRFMQSVWLRGGGNIGT